MIRTSWLSIISFAIVPMITTWKPIVAVDPGTVVAIACGTAAVGFVSNEIRHRWKKRHIHPQIVSELAQKKYHNFKRQASALRRGALLSDPELIIRNEYYQTFSQEHEGLQELQQSVKHMRATIQESLCECNSSSQARFGQLLTDHEGKYQQLLSNLQELERSSARTSEILRLHKRLKDIDQKAKVLLGDAAVGGGINCQNAIAYALTHNKSVARYLKDLEKMIQEANTAGRRLRELQAPERALSAEGMAQSMQQLLGAFRSQEVVITELRRERSASIENLQERLQQMQSEVGRLQQSKRRVQNRLRSAQEEVAELRVTARNASNQSAAWHDRQLKSQARTYEDHITQLKRKLNQYQDEAEQLRQKVQSLLNRPLQRRKANEPAARAGSLAMPPRASSCASPSVSLESRPPAGPGFLSRESGGRRALADNIR